MASPSIVVKQVKTNAATPADVYTVPTGRRASVRVHCSTVTAAAVSVSIRKNGAASAASQYIAKSVAVGANSREVFPSGSPFLVDEDDVVTVESDQADTAWVVNGYEDDVPA